MSSAKPSMAYPFVTRRQVLERLDRDPAFVRECVEILHRRFVDRDVLPPPAGWMSSERKIGEEVFARLTSADCTATDVEKGAALAKRYAKQLAKVLRDDQLARDPRLGLAAAVFGVRRTEQGIDLDSGEDPYANGEDADQTDGTAEAPADALAPTPEARQEPVATEPSAAAETAPLRRRPGRPKRSKNKPKAEVARAKSTKRRRP